MSRTTIIFHKRSADLALVTFPFTEAGKLLSHFSCKVEAVSGVLLFRLWICPSQWAVMKKAFWRTEAKTAKWFSHWHLRSQVAFPLSCNGSEGCCNTEIHGGKTQNAPLQCEEEGDERWQRRRGCPNNIMWWFHMDSYDWWLKMYKNGSTCLH